MSAAKYHSKEDIYSQTATTTSIDPIPMNMKNAAAVDLSPTL
jgi:hypothetical protein